MILKNFSFIALICTAMLALAMIVVISKVHQVYELDRYLARQSGVSPESDYCFDYGFCKNEGDFQKTRLTCIDMLLGDETISVEDIATVSATATSSGNQR